MNKYQDALNKIKCIGEKDLWNDRHLEWTNTLQELIDKETPKKPPLIWEYAKPKTRCQCTNGVYRYQNYCSNCGQKIDWSK